MVVCPESVRTKQDLLDMIDCNREKFLKIGETQIAHMLEHLRMEAIDMRENDTEKLGELMCKLEDILSTWFVD